MYAASDVTPAQMTAKYFSQADMELDAIEDLDTAKKQLERARQKAEKYRVELAEHRDVASGAYSFKAKISGMEKEIEKLQNDKEELRNTLRDYETKLLVASGATQGSLDRETVKALQKADLAQRKTISNQMIDIEFMLKEIKILRRLLADTDVDLEGVETWEDMRPDTSRAEWAGSLGMESWRESGTGQQGYFEAGGDGRGRG